MRSMRTLLPKANAIVNDGPEHEQRPEDAAQASSPPANEASRFRNPRKTAQDWERIKGQFSTLYVDQDRSLNDTMEILKNEYGFSATRNQLNFMIKKWKIDKKVKGREMQHVVRIRRRRQAGTFPRKTKFRVRDRTVDQAKIDRFEREHTILSKLSSKTPSVISYRSLTPRRKSPSERRSSLVIERSSPALNVKVDLSAGSRGLPRPSSTRYHGDMPSVTPNQALEQYSVYWSNHPSTIRRPIALFADTDTMQCENRPIFPVERRGLATGSPSLEPFDWWQNYYEWSRRRDLPRSSAPPLVRLLEPLIIPRDTYADEMFNHTKLHELQILKTEASFYGEGSPSTRCSCTFHTTRNAVVSFCTLLKFTLPALAKRGVTLSYSLDVRWMLSEMAKVLIVFSSTTHYQDSYVQNLLQILYDPGLAAREEADEVCDMMSHVRAYPAGGEMALCLMMTIFAWGTCNFREAKSLLRRLLGGKYETLNDAEMVLNIAREAYRPEGGEAQETNEKLRRWVLCQLLCILWFESHPRGADNLFSKGKSWPQRAVCGGFATSDFHVCLGKTSCRLDSQIVRNNPWWCGFQIAWTMIRRTGYILEAADFNISVVRAADFLDLDDANDLDDPIEWVRSNWIIGEKSRLPTSEEIVARIGSEHPLTMSDVALRGIGASMGSETRGRPVLQHRAGNNMLTPRGSSHSEAVLPPIREIFPHEFSPRDNDLAEIR